MYTNDTEPERKGGLNGLKFHPDGTFTGTCKSKHTWQGATYTGSLHSDARILWSDGDIWIRDKEVDDSNAKFTMSWSAPSGCSFFVAVAPLKMGVTASFKGEVQPAGRIWGSSMGKAGVHNDRWD